MSNEIIVFFSFLLIVGFMLMLDLGVFNKNSHKISLKEAGIWTSVWVLVSIACFVFIRFNGNILHDIKDIAHLQTIISTYNHPIDISGKSFEDAISIYNNNLSLEYITGYLIEYALSVDNIFVIVMIFLAFGVEPKYYHRVLFWGIIGALIMRFIFIFLSSALIQNFGWILYVFGFILIFTGVKMFISRNKEDKVETEKHPAVRFVSKYFSMTEQYEGQKFWIKKGKKMFFTPLFLVLIVIEFTDVIFAVDSVPAIFSITKDPYIVFFSNIFAILGLRSLFFLLVGIMDLFLYLKTGLSVLLIFI